MPAAIAAHPLRRPFMLLAAWLVVLQAFLAGVAIAQAASVSIADPLAVICHGVDAGKPTDVPTPGTGKAWHLCCMFCLSSVPALLTPDVPGVARTRIGRAVPGALLSPFGVILARGLIRAGPSQAPPALA